MVFGGRVECLQGPGKWNGLFRLYDVNSMYPHVMAEFSHPIGAEFFVDNRITDLTAFVRVRCTNHGALLARDTDGSITTNIANGEFNTTIHEYKTALELGMIENVENSTDC